jgi:hypothetical protein
LNNDEKLFNKHFVIEFIILYKGLLNGVKYDNVLKELENDETWNPLMQYTSWQVFDKNNEARGINTYQDFIDLYREKGLLESTDYVLK